MTRRTVIWSPLVLGARRAWNMLANGVTSAWAAKGAVPNLPPDGERGIILENSNHKLEFDRKNARLLSMRARSAPEQEFAVASSDLPVFVIQYLTSEKRFQQIDSTQAQEVNTRTADDKVIADFTGLSGLDLEATVTIRTRENDALTYWTISVRNHANIAITDVQFPFVVSPYHLGGKPGSEALLQPLMTGRFWEAPKPEDLEPDSPHAWQFRPENTDTSHYPGVTFAQFLTYYNDRAGIYLACQDSTGSIKLIKPVHNRAEGIRLGIAHVGDWPSNGDRDLGYDVVLRAFNGDWYDAAALYRDWSLQQPWAATPLHKRKDVPEWLLDSPPHIVVRIQGQVDNGPAEPNEEFLPYPKIMPLLEKISKRIDSPLVAVVMSWERPGPWVYPDCFPPAGGDDSLSEFTQLAKARGWHVGSYSNGTRWVTKHYWTGYDGDKYFSDHNGAETVCRTHDQKLWEESWGNAWRPSYACCLGVARTREIANSFVRRLLADGLDWMQFLDQNACCSTFPCFAANHGHPPGPGKWMNAAMQSLLDDFRHIADDEAKKSGGQRRFAFSVETPPNEFFMPNFQVCDQRVAPPGHGTYGTLFFPLYSFLYHEFVLLQGGFGLAPAPYHMQICSAGNLVIGQIPGAILTGDGKLLNRGETNHWWMPWSPAVGNNEDSLAMLRCTSALRRGKAKEFLVFGRMQRPSEVAGIKIIHWESDGLVRKIPAVLHSAWRSPEGRFGIVMANWTKDVQVVSISDARLGKQFLESISTEDVKTRVRQANPGKVSVSLPSLSCVLVETG
jgi:hypothetical protein